LGFELFANTKKTDQNITILQKFRGDRNPTKYSISKSEMFGEQLGYFREWHVFWLPSVLKGMLNVPLHRLEAKERAGVVLGANWGPSLLSGRQGYSSNAARSTSSSSQLLAFIHC
jgi:hypothetical protein